MVMNMDHIPISVPVIFTSQRTINKFSGMITVAYRPDTDEGNS